MNTSIAQFMKIALTVVVISGLLFFVGYKMVNDEVTGAGGYQATVTGIEVPTASSVRTTR